MMMIFFSLSKSGASKEDVMVDVLIKKRVILPKDNAKKSDSVSAQNSKKFEKDLHTEKYLGFSLSEKSNHFESVVKSKLDLSSVSKVVEKYKKNLCSVNKGGSFEIWFSFEGGIGMVVFGSGFDTGIKATINCAE